MIVMESPKHDMLEAYKPKLCCVLDVFHYRLQYMRQPVLEVERLLADASSSPVSCLRELNGSSC